MLYIINELPPLAPNIVMMIVLGVVALYILFLLLRQSSSRKFKPKPTETYKAVPQTRQAAIVVPPIPHAPTGAKARWMVLDLQTTGLSTIRGAEDLIVEATWLLLDEAYQLIRKRTHRVYQSYSGSQEAQEVHGLSEQDLRRHGITEAQLVEYFLADLLPQTTIVMHNAEFDLAIILSTIERVAPNSLPQVRSHSTFCTMTYLPLEHYPSLGALTTSITSFTQAQFRALRPISYRNAYFTRHCLIALQQL
ncbi:3'-5' exonuclease [Porphyromonas levii]|uniref:3'-5' exonuclease n=1 Tax=Porphyromonas levii TaxID=28114 RepID=UPI001B8CDB46|nr:3'-5' exonuclease [Porphyromonas levii]MBR8703308.1 hypothetical protein [Porphyromonas levii]MBR8770146.1 hypothetical protein [Porphyromonas levii]